MRIWVTTGAIIFAACLFGALPIIISNTYLQNICFSISSAALSVALGLIAVNIILNSSDRKMVAQPLYALIARISNPLHNELFIQLGWDTFGREKFGSLIDTFQNNSRRANAFGPDDTEKLFIMIMSKKDLLAKIYLDLELTASDTARIVGWGYDPKILTIILHIKTLIVDVNYIFSTENHELKTKRDLIEGYFNIEGACTTWTSLLRKKFKKGD